MSRRLISNMEKNIIKDACFNGAFKGVTWGDVCDMKKRICGSCQKFL